MGFINKLINLFLPDVTINIKVKRRTDGRLQAHFTHRGVERLVTASDTKALIDEITKEVGAGTMRSFDLRK